MTQPPPGPPNPQGGWPQHQPNQQGWPPGGYPAQQAQPQGQPQPGQPQQGLQYPQQPPPYGQQYPQTYPQGYPQAYPPGPPGPPPKTSRTGVWVALGLVVLLLAAGGVTAAFLLNSDGGDQADPQPIDSTSSCTGRLCIGPYHYVNACRMVPPGDYAGLLGSMGSDPVKVEENYAESLPGPQDGRDPSWYFGLESECSAVGGASDADIDSVSVDIEQYSAIDRATTRHDGGSALPGVRDVTVQRGGHSLQLSWAHRNVSATVTVYTGYQAPTVPDDKLAAFVRRANAGIDRPVSEKTRLAAINRGGATLIQDACEVFTAKDFEAATGYVIDPLNVTRGYRTPLDTGEGVTCQRRTATESTGVPATGGLTFLDAAMDPTVKIGTFPSPAAARTLYEEDRGEIYHPESVPGLGEVAVFGTGSSTDYALEVRRGATLLRIECGVTTGNADWTPQDMRRRLEPIAKAVLAKI